MRVRPEGPIRRLNLPGHSTPLDKQQPPYRITVKHFLSAGDSLVLSAAIRSLKAAHGDRFQVAVAVTYPEIFWHNPDVDWFSDRSFVARMSNKHWPLAANGLHFMEVLCVTLGELLGVDIPLATDRPHLYLDEDEAAWQPHFDRPYIIINGGFKEDMPTKRAGTHAYQKVVDWLTGQGYVVVQVGKEGYTNGGRNHHQRLTNVVDLVGKTNPRQLFALVNKAAFGVGPITFLQHVCAALEVPYVCVAGGREPPTFVAYPRQKLLHTIGRLDCCQQACWRSSFGLPGQNGCFLPVVDQCGETVAECMRMIGADGIIEACEQIMCERQLNTA